MILQADARHIPLSDNSVQCCVTSPPYWGLRDYGVSGQLGLERTPEEYVANMVAVFREVRRVMREDGTCWVNMGDSYVSNASNQVPQTKQHGSGRADGVVDDRAQRNRNGIACESLKPKDLVGIPWRLAFALQADGWYLRSDIIWAKPNPMPESVTDRPTKSHEYIFLLTKSARYYFDQEAVREASQDFTNTRSVNEDGSQQIRKAWVEHKERDHKTDLASWGSKYGSLVPANGRNLRSVWSIATAPYPEAHFATFPPEIPKRCILAGTKTGDVVLDPFAGSGTTIAVAESLGRRGVGLELKPEYIALAKKRCQVTLGLPF